MEVFSRSLPVGTIINAGDGNVLISTLARLGRPSMFACWFPIKLRPRIKIEEKIGFSGGA